jgi:hypothetical protein
MHLEHLARTVLAKRATSWLPHHIDDMRRELTEIDENREAYQGHIAQAREQATDEFEIDEKPYLDVCHDGVWVSAWIWVPTPTNEELDEA